jgi:hypothetical protein
MRTLGRLAAAAVWVGVGVASAAAGEVRLGVLAGFNEATLASDITGLSAKFAWRHEAGLLLEIQATDGVSLLLEPVYVVRGAQVDPAQLNLDFSGTPTAGLEGHMQLSYVDIPLWLKVGSHARLVRPYVLAGPCLSVLTRAKVLVREPFGGQFLDETVDIKDGTRTVDFGLGLGGGVSVELGKFQGILEVVYVHGLVDIAKNDAESLKNRGVQVRIGLTLPLRND